MHFNPCFHLFGQEKIQPLPVIMKARILLHSLQNLPVQVR